MPHDGGSSSYPPQSQRLNELRELLPMSRSALLCRSSWDQDERLLQEDLATLPAREAFGLWWEASPLFGETPPRPRCSECECPLLLLAGERRQICVRCRQRPSQVRYCGMRAGDGALAALLRRAPRRLGALRRSGLRSQGHTNQPDGMLSATSAEAGRLLARVPPRGGG